MGQLGAGDWAPLTGREDISARRHLGAAVSAIFGPQSVGALRAGGPALLFAILATIAVLIVSAGLAVRLAVAAPGRTRRSGTS